MYGLTLPINNIADAKYFNNWLKENVTFNGVTYDDNEVVVYFESEPNQSTKDTVINQYSGLTTSQILYSDTIKERYDIFKKDGEEYFDNIRVNLVISYENSGLTESDIYEIESKLDPAITKILRGDWMSGKNEMSSIVVEGSLSQSLYDEINNHIINYVSNNY